MSSCEFTIWILMNLIDLVVRLDGVLTWIVSAMPFYYTNLYTISC